MPATLKMKAVLSYAHMIVIAAPVIRQNATSLYVSGVEQELSNVAGD